MKKCIRLVSMLLVSIVLFSCGSLSPSLPETENTKSSQEIDKEIQEELDVMNNKPLFDVTTSQFENKMEETDFYKNNLTKTPYGYITKNKNIEIVIKSEDTPDDEKIPVVYMYLTKTVTEKTAVEEGFYDISSIIFNCLNDNLNKEKLLPIIKKTGNEEEEIIYSEKTRINFSITDQETQIAITPSPH